MFTASEWDTTPEQLVRMPVPVARVKPTLLPDGNGIQIVITNEHAFGVLRAVPVLIGADEGGWACRVWVDTLRDNPTSKEKNLLLTLPITTSPITEIVVFNPYLYADESAESGVLAELEKLMYVTQAEWMFADALTRIPGMRVEKVTRGQKLFSLTGVWETYRFQFELEPGKSRIRIPDNATEDDFLWLEAVNFNFIPQSWRRDPEAMDVFHEVNSAIDRELPIELGTTNRLLCVLAARVTPRPFTYRFRLLRNGEPVLRHGGPGYGIHYSAREVSALSVHQARSILESMYRDIEYDPHPLNSDHPYYRERQPDFRVAY